MITPEDITGQSKGRQLKNQIWRKLRGVVAVAAAGLLAIAATGVANADGSVVDGARRGSLTIHKFEAPEVPTGLPANGTEQEVSLTPLEGVGFTVYRVSPIDLTTNAGWTKAAELSDAFDGTSASISGAGFDVTPIGAERFTNSDGVIGLTDLDLGLYYVVETAPKAGSTAVAPFLVSVPLTDPVEKDQWLYDVHVYPKNALTNLNKTVEDGTAVKLGDEIVYTITADIPNVDSISKYKIVDALDSKLNYVSAAVTLSNGTALVRGTDYTVTPDTATANGPTVVVEFTAAGREKLVANNDASVEVALTTTVRVVGEIENEALLYPNAESYDIAPGEPGGPAETPGVVTKWGEITIEKLDVDGETKLTGAVFQVYLSEADARAGSNALTLDGKTDFPVDVNGLLTISGLRYSAWADGKAVAPGEDGFRQYWLSEKVAPEGYELLAAPISFLINAETSSVGVDLEVLNVPANGGFDLPSTGGSGNLAYWVGGGVLLGGGLAALIIVVRRRNQAKA